MIRGFLGRANFQTIFSELFNTLKVLANHTNSQGAVKAQGKGLINLQGTTIDERRVTEVVKKGKVIREILTQDLRHTMCTASPEALVKSSDPLKKLVAVVSCNILQRNWFVMLRLLEAIRKFSLRNFLKKLSIISLFITLLCPSHEVLPLFKETN